MFVDVSMRMPARLPRRIISNRSGCMSGSPHEWRTADPTSPPISSMIWR
jgi:hypothetical protein